MYLLRKNMRILDIVKELKDVYRDEALSKTQVYFWVKEIKMGREDLNNLPKEGRPIDEQLIVSIQDHLKKEPFSSSRKIALELHVSHDTILRHLTQTLGYKCMNLRWVPHFLTPEQKSCRVKLAKILIPIIKQEEATGFEFLLTGDESLFIYRYQYKSKWVVDVDDLEERVEETNFSKKTMFTIFVNGKGVQLIDVKPTHVKIDANYFINYILMNIEGSELMKKSRNMKHKLLVHYDNAPCHSAKTVKEHLRHSGLIILSHPPYSPDLAICDFGLFGTMKNSFAGNEFETEDDLTEAIKKFFASKSEDFYKSLFFELIRRLEACVANNGNYIQ
ncbi:histone-lysine N-methyltransferase SETMAR-like protein [Histomonas meleagridis]|nr:histone-lysine N-methyltransferase SETMAR-like protein [Histomonas meleagridis]